MGDTGNLLQLPKKYIAEALESIFKFKRNNAFEHTVIREFHSLLREAMIGARGGSTCSGS